MHGKARGFLRIAFRCTPECKLSAAINRQFDSAHYHARSTMELSSTNFVEAGALDGAANCPFRGSKNREGN